MWIYVAILRESVIFKFPVKGIKHNSINREMFSTKLLRACCVFLQNEKNVGYLVGDTALHRHYKWSTATIYDTYFTGNELGAVFDVHQPQIFLTRSISGVIIASHLPRCSAGTDCKDSQNFYLACRCYCWW